MRLCASDQYLVRIRPFGPQFAGGPLPALAASRLEENAPGSVASAKGGRGILDRGRLLRPHWTVTAVVCGSSQRRTTDTTTKKRITTEARTEREGEGEEPRKTHRKKDGRDLRSVSSSTFSFPTHRDPPLPHFRVFRVFRGSSPPFFSPCPPCLRGPIPSPHVANTALRLSGHRLRLHGRVGRLLPGVVPAGGANFGRTCRTGPSL